ncbi:hypothetical protein [Saccharopolyspora cebuensis]|uniref:Uncharacterized protein n=2 Tax=Saccharopolyspora cebuensis TaxID=418759 RepID=A0ABV4CLZ7_9PSEU
MPYYSPLLAKIGPAEQRGIFMPDFFTDKQGNVRPINGKKGGGGMAVTAGATALAIAAYSGGAGVTSGGFGSIAGESLFARTSHAQQAARKGQHDKAWQQLRLRIPRQRAPQRTLGCVVHSFGEVREFFVRNPCRSLVRTLVPLEDEHGNSAVVSIAWVRMPTGRGARALERLNHRQGTGDLTALGQGALTARGVVFTGDHYRGDARGKLFVRAETAPAVGTMEPGLMEAAAKVAVLLPPP